MKIRNIVVLMLSLTGGVLLLNSCSSTSGSTNDYFGYNNSPKQKSETQAVQQAQSGQNQADTTSQKKTLQWKNPLSSENPDIVTGNSVNDNSNANLSSGQSSAPVYVTVISPWYADYYDWGYYRHYAYYQPWHYRMMHNRFYYDWTYNDMYWGGWYSPWYSYHPWWGYGFYDYPVITYYNYYWWGSPGYARQAPVKTYRNFGPGRGGAVLSGGSLNNGSTPRKSSRTDGKFANIKAFGTPGLNTGSNSPLSVNNNTNRNGNNQQRKSQKSGRYSYSPVETASNNLKATKSTGMSSGFSSNSGGTSKRNSIGWVSKPAVEISNGTKATSKGNTGSGFTPNNNSNGNSRGRINSGSGDNTPTKTNSTNSSAPGRGSVSPGNTNSGGSSSGRSSEKTPNSPGSSSPKKISGEYRSFQSGKNSADTKASSYDKPSRRQSSDVNSVHTSRSRAYSDNTSTSGSHTRSSSYSGNSSRPSGGSGSYSGGSRSGGSSGSHSSSSGSRSSSSGGHSSSRAR